MINSKVKGSRYFYYWWSEAIERRIGWVFASPRDAKKWRDRRCRRYVKFPFLEDWLKQFNEKHWEVERKLWLKDRDEYQDLVLKRGILKYIIGKNEEVRDE